MVLLGIDPSLLNSEYVQAYTCELSLGVLQIHAKSSEHSNEIRELEHVPSNNDQPDY